MTTVAFDLGLNRTGICWAIDGYDTYTPPANLRSTPITHHKEHERYRWWRDTFRAILLPHPRSLVAVEAPILHHRNGSTGLITLHGILRAVALDNKSDYLMVAPTVLKQVATGRGDATKPDMCAAAAELGWDGTDHNEADAFLLWWHTTNGAFDQ